MLKLSIIWSIVLEYLLVTVGNFEVNPVNLVVMAINLEGFPAHRQPY